MTTAPLTDQQLQQLHNDLDANLKTIEDNPETPNRERRLRNATYALHQVHAEIQRRRQDQAHA